LRKLRGKDDGLYLSVFCLFLFLFLWINKMLKMHECINMSIILFPGINAGVAGCCTGLALSFPGKVSGNVQSIALNFFNVQLLHSLFLNGLVRTKVTQTIATLFMPSSGYETIALFYICS